MERLLSKRREEVERQFGKDFEPVTLTLDQEDWQLCLEKRIKEGIYKSPRYADGILGEIARLLGEASNIGHYSGCGDIRSGYFEQLTEEQRRDVVEFIGTPQEVFDRANEAIRKVALLLDLLTSVPTKDTIEDIIASYKEGDLTKEEAVELLSTIDH